MSCLYVLAISQPSHVMSIYNTIQSYSYHITPCLPTGALAILAKHTSLVYLIHPYSY